MSMKRLLDDDEGVAGEIIYLVLFIALGCILFILYNPLMNLGITITNYYASIGWLSQTGHEKVYGSVLLYQSWPYIIGITAVIAGISGTLALKKLNVW